MSSNVNNGKRAKKLGRRNSDEDEGSEMELNEEPESNEETAESTDDQSSVSDVKKSKNKRKKAEKKMKSRKRVSRKESSDEEDELDDEDEEEKETEGSAESETHSNNESNDDSKRKKSVKTRGRRLRKVDSKNRKRQISEVEDGEVSDSDLNTTGNEFGAGGGGGGSGSDSSDSSVFNDGYDSDLLGDEEDRRRLDAMTEKEREEEIYRRTEQRDLLMKRFEMRKKLKQQQKAANRQKRREEKRKKKKGMRVGDEEEEDEEAEEEEEGGEGDEGNSSLANVESSNEDALNRSSLAMDRRKVNESKRKDTHVSKALANLKADREKKKQQAEDQKQRQEKIETGKSSSKARNDDIFSSSDQEKSEEKKKKKKKKKREKSSSDEVEESSEQSEASSSSSEDEDKGRQQLISTKEELNKIKLSRFKIEKWCHAPFFKKVASGCYVRIGIGLNQGTSIYRVAKVMDVVETAKVYQLGSTKTNKGFKLKHGEDERIYRLEFVSNQPFSDNEFIRWKEALQKESLSLPSVREIEEKQKEIQTFLEYRFNDEDIDHIVHEKRRFMKDTGKTAAEKKIELLKERENAEQQNDQERVREIDLEIKELSDKADEVTMKRSGNFNILATINQRNRALSNIKVEEAMKREFERLKEQKDDPFMRRKALPTLVAAKLKKGGVVAADSKLVEEQKPSAPLQKPNETIKKSGSAMFEDLLAPSTKQSLRQSDPLSRLTTPSSASVAKSSNPDDLFNAHNFEINIDLSVPSATTQQTNSSMSSTMLPSSSLSRRALNLDEYKKKKGLI